MRTRKRAVLCATLLVSALAGCGSSGGGADDQVADKRESGDNATAAADADESPPESDTTGIDFSGVVKLGNSSSGPELTVVDPKAPGGEPLERIELPPNESAYSEWSFSTDWQYVVWTTAAGAIHVGELDPAQRAYVPSFSIEPGEGSYLKAPTEYDNPRFSSDGETLWFEARTGERTITLASVSYAEHGQGDEPQLSNVKVRDQIFGFGEGDWWTLGENGDPVLTRQQEMRQITHGQHDELVAKYWMGRSGSIAKLEIQAFNYPDDVTSQRYRAVERLGPKELLVVAWDDEEVLVSGAADKYGALAKATIDPAARSIDLEPIVPLGAGGLPEWTVVSPDQSEALLCVRDKGSDTHVPYLASLQPGSAEPEQVSRNPCADTGVPLEWS